MALPSLPDQLANAFKKYQIRVFRFATHLDGDVQGRLKGMRADLVRITAQADPTEPARLGDRLNRVNAATSEARKVVAARYRGVATRMANELTDYAATDQTLVAGILERTAGTETITPVKGPRLERIVERALVDGAPSSEWWGRQAGDVVRRYKDQLTQGMQAGENIGDLIDRVRGTAERNYEDGIMGVSRRQAEALIRSSVMSVGHDVRMAQFEENSDVIRGWSISVTFDDRTCAVCQALSGASFDLDGDPLPGSPFGSRLASDGLPIHWQCRCIAVPLLVGEGEPQDLDFENWLDDQPEAEQIAVLGPQWHAAWKSGELTDLRARIDQKGRPLTLKDIRAEAAQAAPAKAKAA